MFGLASFTAITRKYASFSGGARFLAYRLTAI